MPTVTVVIPTFNRPGSLERAIRSVLRQTFHDFEVIVVDDGGPNAVAEPIVRGFDDPRLLYCRTAGSEGPAAARNAAVARATGRYIAFLDDDDEWLPEKLEIQVPLLDRSESQVGLVHSGRITVDEATGKAETTPLTGPFDPRRGNTVTTSSVLMRRGCFEVVGRFDEKLRAGSDFDMWVRLADVYRFVCVDRPLVRYFIHEGYQISHDDSVTLVSRQRLLVKHRRIYESSRRRHGSAHLLLAMQYDRLGQVGNARAALFEALRLWPFTPAIYKLFLKMLIRKGAQWSASLRSQA